MLTKQIDDKSSVDISEITWNTDMTYLCIFFSRSTFFLCIRTCMQDSIRFSFSQSYTFSSLFFQITIIRVHILFTAQSTYDLISRLQMNSSHRSKLINNARGANEFQITSCYIIFTQLSLSVRIPMDDYFIKALDIFEQQTKLYNKTIAFKWCNAQLKEHKTNCKSQ